jgi:hypothetical protein
MDLRRTASSHQVTLAAVDPAVCLHISDGGSHVAERVTDVLHEYCTELFVLPFNASPFKPQYKSRVPTLTGVFAYDSGNREPPSPPSYCHRDQ